MKTPLVLNRAINSDWGCFSGFDKTNPICQKKCALRLRCAVTREKIARMELLEELTSDEMLPPIVQ